MSLAPKVRGIGIEFNGGDDGSLLFQRFPSAAKRSASRAINRVMNRNVIPLAKEEIYSQVNFPDGYLDRQERLYVKKISTPTDLEGVVAGRERPTSLARFASNYGGGAIGVQNDKYTFQVKRGENRRVPGFFVRLASGNLGFAIRLRKGETLHGSTGAVPLTRNGKATGSYLLYGPSVDQVFNEVTDEIAPNVETALTREFYRLMDVEFNGGTVNEDDD